MSNKRNSPRIISRLEDDDSDDYLFLWNNPPISDDRKFTYYETVQVRTVVFEESKFCNPEVEMQTNDTSRPSVCDGYTDFQQNRLRGGIVYELSIGSKVLITSGDPTPFVGEIISLFEEKKSGKKKFTVRWFWYESDVLNQNSNILSEIPRCNPKLWSFIGTTIQPEYVPKIQNIIARNDIVQLFYSSATDVNDLATIIRPCYIVFGDDSFDSNLISSGNTTQSATDIDQKDDIFFCSYEFNHIDEIISPISAETIMIESQRLVNSIRAMENAISYNSLTALEAAERFKDSSMPLAELQAARERAIEIARKEEEQRIKAMRIALIKSWQTMSCDDLSRYLFAVRANRQPLQASPASALSQNSQQSKAESNGDDVEDEDVDDFAGGSYSDAVNSSTAQSPRLEIGKVSLPNCENLFNQFSQQTFDTFSPHRFLDETLDFTNNFNDFDHSLVIDMFEEYAPSNYRSDSSRQPLWPSALDSNEFFSPVSSTMDLANERPTDFSDSNSVAMQSPYLKEKKKKKADVARIRIGSRYQADIPSLQPSVFLTIDQPSEGKLYWSDDENEQEQERKDCKVWSPLEDDIMVQTYLKEAAIVVESLKQAYRMSPVQKDKDKNGKEENHLNGVKRAYALVESELKKAKILSGRLLVDGSFVLIQGDLEELLLEVLFDSGYDEATALSLLEMRVSSYLVHWNFSEHEKLLKTCARSKGHAIAASFKKLRNTKSRQEILEYFFRYLRSAFKLPIEHSLRAVAKSTILSTKAREVDLDLAEVRDGGNLVQIAYIIFKLKQSLDELSVLEIMNCLVEFMQGSQTSAELVIRVKLLVLRGRFNASGGSSGCGESSVASGSSSPRSSYHYQSMIEVLSEISTVLPGLVSSEEQAIHRRYIH